MPVITEHMPGWVEVQIPGVGLMKDSGIGSSVNLIIFINMSNFMPVRVVEGVIQGVRQGLISGR